MAAQEARPPPLIDGGCGGPAARFGGGVVGRGSAAGGVPGSAFMMLTVGIKVDEGNRAWPPPPCPAHLTSLTPPGAAAP